LGTDELGKVVQHEDTSQGGDEDIDAAMADAIGFSNAGGVVRVRSNGYPLRSSEKLSMGVEYTAQAKCTPTRSSGRKRVQTRDNTLTLSESAASPVSPSHDTIAFKPMPEKSLPTSKSARKSALPLEDPVVEITPHTLKKRKRKISNGTVTVAPSGDSPPATIVVEARRDETQPTVDHLEHLRSLLRDPRFHKPFEVLKTKLMEGLTGGRRLPLTGLDEEYQKVHQLVEQTVVAGEGNSMLIIGSRGSGKTTLVETVVSQMTANHAEDFHVVRLNGFIHTDDKIALKDIWRQLGKEMEVEDDNVKQPNSYADTLLSLLALLSHPAELSTADGADEQTSKSVLFIIDEFDLFTSHPRQTLLYNLFDIAQSRKAPVAIIGLTTRIAVVESLEKRVKSRFSHRYVHLPWPKSFGMFRDICKNSLSCESAEAAPRSSTFADRLLDSSNHDYSTLEAAWKRYTSSLLSEDPILLNLLRLIYARTKSVSMFHAACLLPIACMSPEHVPVPADFAANTMFPPDSKLHILTGLSDLELSLLIAAARLDVVLDTDTCNFNMAYDEYLTLSSKAKIQSSASGAIAVGGGARVWGREVAMGAWERLEALDLLVPAMGIGGASGMADVGRAGKLWKVDVALEEIGACGLEMGTAMTKWCKEI
jgi:origin recognition complex subunit 4